MRPTAVRTQPPAISGTDVLVLRNAGIRPMIALVALGTLAVEVVIAESAANHPQLWVIFALLLANLVYGVLVARVAVVVPPSGHSFDVRNPLRTYEVAWRDVDRFEIGAGFYGLPLVVARLRDGSRLKCQALGGGVIKRLGTAQGYLDQMNALLQANSGCRASI